MSYGLDQSVNLSAWRYERTSLRQLAREDRVSLFRSMERQPHGDLVPKGCWAKVDNMMFPISEADYAALLAMGVSESG